MAFPDDSLGLKAEVQIGGAWVGLKLRTADPVQITCGTGSEGSRTEPASCTLKASNKDGWLSPRNPMSPHFEQLGRNTPLRVWLPGPEPYLALSGAVADIAATPDTAALDITGDIDIRAEATGDWYVTRSQTLIGKWSSTDGQRSYILRVFNGLLIFNWTTGGTDATLLNHSASVPGNLRRAAFRATLDVNNGAGGKVSTLYWAPSMDGPWTTLSTATTAGTTSIFSSTTALEIGPSQPLNIPPRAPLRGRVHRAEVRSGIGGTVVASPDFRVQPVGGASFADSAGRTWTLAGAAEITNREILFAGEIADLPPQWTTSGRDAWVSLEAAGLLRRLGQGRKPIQSTLRRRIPTAAGLLAYWPMEEGDAATQAYSPVPGVDPLTVTGLDFAQDDTLPGSAPLPVLKNPATLTGSVPPSSTVGWHTELVYRLPTMPGVQTELLRVSVTGSAMRTAVVSVSTAGVRIEALDSAGDTLAFFLHSDPSALADFPGRWNRLQLFTSDNGGGQTRLNTAWLSVTSGAWWNASTVFTGTQGSPVRVASGQWGAGTEGMALGHLAVLATPGTGLFAGTPIFDRADEGFDRESAIDRLARLSEEEPSLGLSWVDGDTSSLSTPLGPQGQDELLDVVHEVVESDAGILYERMDRHPLGLEYRDRATLYNQTPALVLDYAAGDVAPPLEPKEDDQHVRNDVEVTRRGGSSARVVIDKGPLSALTPEEGGVGPYDEAVTLSLGYDHQPVQHAAWRAHLGTWDEARYPTVRVLLHKRPGLIPAVLRMRIGDLLRITNPPIWTGPGPLDLIVRQINHTPRPRAWEVTFVGTPAGPYRVGVLDDPVLGRLDTDGAVLGAAVDASATALEVHSDQALGPRWVYSADYPTEFPFDVRAGGESMTVTAIANRTDSFTRSVSNSWGTSTSGHVWAENSSPASDRSVNGSRGVLTLASSVSSFRFQRIITTPVGDAEIRVRVSTSAVATGESALPAVLLRYVDASNFYRARVHFGTSGNMFCSVTRTSTQIGSSPSLPYTYSAGQEFEVRVRLTGHTIRIRVWPVGQPEPTVWHHTETVVSSPIEAGQVGLMGSAFAGLTNTNLELRFDQFEVITPQAFTVTRSQNGIVKAQTAGTAVSLANPLRLAL